jgi:hypothetical protein
MIEIKSTESDNNKKNNININTNNNRNFNKLSKLIIFHNDKNLWAFFI